MAGERQSARIRSFYLKSVLRQDIAFFDTEMTTGEAVSRMSSDTVIVQDALGEKVILSLGYQINKHNIFITLHGVK
jgi:ATP-binding cassette subfamily B (MDR/TAP) protein 1